MTDLRLLAYLEGFISAERAARFKEILEERTRMVTVVLEDVFQLHNTSAVIRSCDVFGVQDVHLIEARFGNRLDKNIAMGAQQWVSVHHHPDHRKCIARLRGEGYAIVATTPDYPGAVPLKDFKICGKTALFFGTEKEGLSEEVLQEADTLLSIPMAGFTKSLNISVSAAIVLHEVTNQVRKSDLDWQLTEEEVLELRLEWTKRTIKSVDEILERYRKKA